MNTEGGACKEGKAHQVARLTLTMASPPLRGAPLPTAHLGSGEQSASYPAPWGWRLLKRTALQVHGTTYDFLSPACVPTPCTLPRGRSAPKGRSSLYKRK